MSQTRKPRFVIAETARDIARDLRDKPAPGLPKDAFKNWAKTFERLSQPNNIIRTKGVEAIDEFVKFLEEDVSPQIQKGLEESYEAERQYNEMRREIMERWQDLSVEDKKEIREMAVEEHERNLRDVQMRQMLVERKMDVQRALRELRE
ncbi:hypothetical protein H2203_006294 [Taxawa tesnikishii (nom. ined.)]|nr:hypothetical protein H2203_006294 [Dothideales sp. JES 119]